MKLAFFFVFYLAIVFHEEYVPVDLTNPAACNCSSSAVVTNCEAEVSQQLKYFSMCLFSIEKREMNCLCLLQKYWSSKMGSKK